MKKRMLLLYAAAILLVIPGVGRDRLDLEDTTFPLVFGIDLNPDHTIEFYSSSPIFAKNSKQQSLESEEKSTTFRESRSLEDAHSAGVMQARSIQILMLGKRLLQTEDWYSILDVLFRDPRNSVNARVVAIEGSLESFIELKQKDQPLLPLYLRGLVETANDKSETVETTVQELHRQLLDRGETPFIASMRLRRSKEITLTGTALLDDRGRYVTTLTTDESRLLHILQNDTGKTIGFTLDIPGYGDFLPGTGLDMGRLTFNASETKRKIRVSYAGGKFRYAVDVSMPVAMTEKEFPFDIESNSGKLEKLMAEQIAKQFDDFFAKLQQHKVDPVGFGTYARAFEYDHFKPIKEAWPETFAKADIQVNVRIRIMNAGQERG